MTTTDTPPAGPDLGDFEGKDVLGATIKITNAGDDLSSAMEVAPVILHQGDVVHLVLECTVEPITFKPVKDTDGVQRVHTLKAGRATIIDAEQVTDALDAQQRRIEEAEGTLRLDLDGEQRGGEPQTIGQVLDDAIDLAGDADDGETWREQRRGDLEGWDKPALVTELTDVHEIDPRAKATKPELVDLVLDAEAAQR